MIVPIKWSMGRYCCLCTHDMRVFCANCCVCRDQEVSCRFLTAEDWILSRSSPCGVCAKQSKYGIYSWSGTYLSSCQRLFHWHSILIHLSSRRLNKPVRGLRSTVIQPQYALRLKEIIRLLTKMLYVTNTLTKILYATNTTNGFGCKRNLLPVQLCNTKNG